MYTITSIARYLIGISNFLDLRTEVKWYEHFQIDNKIFRCCHSSNRIEMDFIETEVGTLSWVPLLLKLTLMHLYQYTVQIS